MTQVPETEGVPTEVLWLSALSVLTVVATSAVTALPPHFSPWVKQAIAAGISGLLALAGTYYSGQLDTSDWARTWLIVFMAATTLYVVIVKPVANAVQEKPQT